MQNKTSYWANVAKTRSTYDWEHDFKQLLKRNGFQNVWDFF